MSDWKRTTHEVTLEQLPSDMKAEIQRHIERYNLGDILSDALMCIQTNSEKIKKGLFGGGIISDNRYVVILLGPEMGAMNTPDLVAIWADHTGLAGFARQYFEYLLKDSKVA